MAYSFTWGMREKRAGRSKVQTGSRRLSQRRNGCAPSGRRRHVEREIAAQLGQRLPGAAMVDEDAAHLFPQMAMAELVVDQHVALLGMVALVARHRRDDPGAGKIFRRPAHLLIGRPIA